MKTVVIIGASGHGKVIADIVNKSGDYVLGFLDDNKNQTDLFIGIPILGKVNDYPKYKNDNEFIIAIGDPKIRENISKRLKDVVYYTAIHPTAVISNIGVTIGKGTALMANSIINSGANIGRHCIINSGAIVEHDDSINDFVHISVGSNLAGNVSIGKSVWIGIGAIISNNLNICGDCIIGAGSVVVKDIFEPGTYVGVPAKRIK